MLDEDYPIYHLGIRKGDSVVDVGSGQFPFRLATAVVDKFRDDSTERSGTPIKLNPSQKFIEADIEDMGVIKDKEFKYSIASHILEHVEDPKKACAELMRISKAGYIETPSVFFELMFSIWHKPKPYHRWVVSKEGNRLIFRPREKLLEAFKPIIGLGLNNAIPDASLHEAWRGHPDFFYTRFVWKEGFEVEVREW